MKRSNYALFTVGLLLIMGTALVAGTVYRYRCSRCGLVLTYTRPPGILKCPTDGTPMLPTR